MISKNHVSPSTLIEAMKTCSICGSKHNAGFISTHITSFDSVSKSIFTWSQILGRLNINCFFFTGNSDRSGANYYIVKEAHCQHPEIYEITQNCFESCSNIYLIREKVSQLKRQLKKQIYDFIYKYDIDFLISENALSVPLNIPLGLAISELISETGIPTIAHHHNLAWHEADLWPYGLKPFSIAGEVKIHPQIGRQLLRSDIRVFINYAREDEAIAEKLYDDLKKSGYKIWLDKHDLIPGENWEDKIRDEIEQSNRFLVLLSNNSVTKKGYVQKELRAALSILDELPPSDIFLIPVRIEECEPKFRRLREIHWVDLFTNYEVGLKKIQTALELGVENKQIRPSIQKDDVNSSVSKLTSHESFGLEYLRIAFPPNHPSIQHVLLNSSHSYQLNVRMSRSSTIVPYVMDFQNPPDPLDEYSQDLRKTLGVDDGILIVYPGRIDPTKGIENALQLSQLIGMSAKIAFPNYSLPEFKKYEEKIKRNANTYKANPIFCSHLFSYRRCRNKSGGKVYSIYDLYKHADLFTFLPIADSFGYPVLEAMYYQVPLVVNTYETYAIDIKPKFFSHIEIDGHISDECIRKTRKVLTDQELRGKMTQHNYRQCKRHYSYEVLERKLRGIIEKIGICK